jgi:hypothetical protein
MTLQPLHSEFPYICGKFVFLFYQCTNNLPPGLDPCGQGRFAVCPLRASQSSPLASTLWHVPATQPAVVIGGDPDQSKNRKSACFSCGWLGYDQSEDCNRKLGLSAISLGVPGHGIFGPCSLLLRLTQILTNQRTVRYTRPRQWPMASKP